MASRRKQSDDVFIPMHEHGWREFGCHGDAAPGTAPAQRTNAHAAGALPSWIDGAAARQAVQA